MTMLQNKGNGIGNVSFYYRRYGTDSQVDWKVEYSVDDGSSWIQIGDNFTPLASNDVQEFNEDVNVAGDIRVRIKRATETGTSNKRLNIDDILITDYTGGTPVVVTPSLLHQEEIILFRKRLLFLLPHRALQSITPLTVQNLTNLLFYIPIRYL